MKKSEKVAEATKAIEKEIEEKKFELTLVQKEARNLQKLAKAANKRIAKYDAEKDKADAKRLKLSALVSSLIENVATERTSCEKAKKQLGDFIREREILSKDVAATDERTRKILDVMRIQRNLSEI